MFCNGNRVDLMNKGAVFSQPLSTNPIQQLCYLIYTSVSHQVSQLALDHSYQANGRPYAHSNYNS